MLLINLGPLLQAASLSDFYEICKGLELARNFQFPVLREVRTLILFNILTLYIFIISLLKCLYSCKLTTLLTLIQPPQSFLNTMEEYIREAPRVVSVPSEPMVSLSLSHAYTFFMLEKVYLFTWYRFKYFIYFPIFRYKFSFILIFKCLTKNVAIVICGNSLTCGCKLVINSFSWHTNLKKKSLVKKQSYPMMDLSNKH